MGSSSTIRIFSPHGFAALVLRPTLDEARSFEVLQGAARINFVRNDGHP
jgi:hypothetical protein